MFRLKELRKDANLTQEQLAEQLGLKYFNIGDWERGKCEPCVNDLIKLSQVFGVSVDYLIGNSEDFTTTLPTPSVSVLSKREEKLLEAFSSLDVYQQDFFFRQITATAQKSKR